MFPTWMQLNPMQLVSTVIIFLLNYTRLTSSEELRIKFTCAICAGLSFHCDLQTGNWYHPFRDVKKISALSSQTANKNSHFLPNVIVTRRQQKISNGSTLFVNPATKYIHHWKSSLAREHKFMQGGPCNERVSAVPQILRCQLEVQSARAINFPLIVSQRARQGVTNRGWKCERSVVAD
jgi:hypothetical protein